MGASALSESRGMIAVMKPLVASLGKEQVYMIIDLLG
jgi:hypothetical protein